MHISLEVGRDESELGGDGSLGLEELRFLVVGDDVGRRVVVRVGRGRGGGSGGGRGGDDIEQIGRGTELKGERAVGPANDAGVGLLDLRGVKEREGSAFALRQGEQDTTSPSSALLAQSVRRLTIVPSAPSAHLQRMVCST